MFTTATPMVRKLTGGMRRWLNRSVAEWLHSLLGGLRPREIHILERFAGSEFYCRACRNAALVESVRTPDGPRQRVLCHLGELNGSDHARWLRTVEIFSPKAQR